MTVRILDAIIAPGKADGTSWDGIDTISPAVSQAVAAALNGVNPALSILAVLASPALSALDKPDAFGNAQLTAYGMIGPSLVLATLAAPVLNNYTPAWPLGPGYKNIPIDTDVRISIQLWDKDLIDDDPIPVAEINSIDLQAALSSQQKYEVRVDDQTSGQLLFVGISVVLQQGRL